MQKPTVITSWLLHFSNSQVFTKNWFLYHFPMTTNVLLINALEI